MTSTIEGLSESLATLTDAHLRAALDTANFKLTHVEQVRMAPSCYPYVIAHARTIAKAEQLEAELAAMRAKYEPAPVDPVKAAIEQVYGLGGEDWDRMELADYAFRRGMEMQPAPFTRPKYPVPEGQTPLDDRLGHRYLDVFNEGIAARDTGAVSPYCGQSLEHCLHASGWVQRDIRIALDAALAAQPAPFTREEAETIAKKIAGGGGFDTGGGVYRCILATLTTPRDELRKMGEG